MADRDPAAEGMRAARADNRNADLVAAYANHAKRARAHLHTLLDAIDEAATLSPAGEVTPDNVAEVARVERTLLGLLASLDNTDAVEELEGSTVYRCPRCDAEVDNFNAGGERFDTLAEAMAFDDTAAGTCYERGCCRSWAADELIAEVA